MIDKTLIIVVTRDNPVLLQHIFQSFEKYNPGAPCEFLIVDNNSQLAEQQKALDKLSKNYKITTEENNRVETSFDIAWRKNQNYRYYFFLHDDVCANKDNWLKIFIDRLHSDYTEEIIKNTHLAKYPIGKVGALSQFWRSYTSILGYSVQCVFLKQMIQIMEKEVPPIFKYCDCDRVLIRNECLKDTNGIRNLQEFKDLKSQNPNQFAQLCEVLRRDLPYYDEGIPPRNLYPAGECWNKFCLTAEFMNSIDPLIQKWRTVALEGDGFLEQIMGYDNPFGHDFLAHYGAPNMKQFVGKTMNCDPGEVSKHFNNKIFLMKMDKLIKDHFKHQTKGTE